MDTANEQVPLKNGGGARAMTQLRWPAAFAVSVIAVLIYLRTYPNVEPTQATIDLKKLTFVVALASAGKERKSEDGSTPPAPNPAAIARTAQRAFSTRLQGSNVLWVDNKPDWNTYERQAFQQLGVNVVLADNTAQALELLAKQSFQLVITNFKRPDDPQAGYTLLTEMKKANSRIPLIIYSGSANPDFIAEAKGRGAFSETNQPEALFNDAIDAIKGS